MKIFVAADHAGFAAKQALVAHLNEQGHEVVDFGAHEFNEKDDYPDFMIPLAREVAKDPELARGIIIGGTGQGEAMAVNRVKGVRAAVIYAMDPSVIALTREHNNANVLALGARLLGVEEILAAADLWLSAQYSRDERHERRLAKIDA